MTGLTQNHDTEIKRLTFGQLLELKNFDTPTIHNGWEQITSRNPGRECFNLEGVTDFMPEMGTMIGYAVTLVLEPGNREHAKNTSAWSEYRRYVAAQPGPKIVVVQDLDKPRVFGSGWGEVQANVHHQIGCAGVIVDGAVRDVPQMRTVGFKALARRLCVGHAYATPVRWGTEVDVFGCMVQPGQLLVADQHGFLAIPIDEESRILEAVAFMDRLERHTKIATARNARGLPYSELLDEMDEANRAFAQRARARFGRSGES
jgi:4-hydroxy-4-methyl-2-oxoglutarate aldolase